MNKNNIKFQNQSYAMASKKDKETIDGVDVDIVRTGALIVLQKDDPYLYDDVDVLANKLGIKDEKELDLAEARFVTFRIVALRKQGFKIEFLIIPNATHSVPVTCNIATKPNNLIVFKLSKNEFFKSFHWKI